MAALDPRGVYPGQISESDGIQNQNKANWQQATESKEKFCPDGFKLLPKLTGTCLEQGYEFQLLLLGTKSFMRTASAPSATLECHPENLQHACRRNRKSKET